MTGYAPAQVDLGLSMTQGTGITTNFAEALILFRKAAQAHYAPGAYQIGMAYKNGRGVEPDPAEALKWFTDAAELGLPLGVGAVAAYYSDSAKDHRKAATFAERGARMSDAISLVIWGDLQREGEVVPINPAEAAQSYRHAAEQGNAVGAARWGSCLLGGKGVPTDLAEGVKWLRFAAERGERQAQNDLGLCWFARAARQGQAGAQNSYGYSLGNGIGVQTNLVEAYKWLSLALAQKDLQAKVNLPALEARLSPEQIQEGKEQAASFRPRLEVSPQPKAINLETILKAWY